MTARTMNNTLNPVAMLIQIGDTTQIQGHVITPPSLRPTNRIVSPGIKMLGAATEPLLLLIEKVPSPAALADKIITMPIPPNA